MMLPCGVETCSVDGSHILLQNMKQNAKKYMFLYDMVSESDKLYVLLSWR